MSLAAPAFILLLGQGAAPKADWWNQGWAFRREIAIRSEQPGFVCVRFATCGRAKGDGSDVVVLRDGKTRVPNNAKTQGT